jgi:hypothetical protein
MSTINIIGSFTDEGTPKESLVPIVGAWEMNGTVAVDPGTETMTEIGGGLYFYSWAVYDETKDYAIRLDSDDGDMSDNDRYKFGTNDQSSDATAVKLPSKAYLSGSADADGGIDFTERAVIGSITYASLLSYDGPTRTEATSDMNEILNEVDSIGTKIDSVQGDVTDILADTNEVQGMLPGKGYITGSDNSDGNVELDDATGALPAGAFANHPAVELSSTAVDAILDEVIETEGPITLRQAASILIAQLAGEASGGGTTEITFSTPNGNADRIVMTVDQNGNRSTVTLTPSLSP